MDEDGRESKITVSLEYLPVKMVLDPSESRNNQGNLRVDVLDAADLPAADRSGYSDPYCKFNLNGKEVFKTKVQKKTLHPAWNEYFEVPVRSRTAAKFEVNVYDWDFGDKADFLGKAAINLDLLEPFQRQEVVLGLDGKSGTIRLGMLFKPDYVTRSRQGSSTFSGTFNAPGKIVGAPVKGIGKGAVFVGGGVAKGASFLGKGFKRRKSRGETEEATSPALEDGINGFAQSPGSPAGPLRTPIINVEANDANKDLPSTPHQRIRSFGSAVVTPGGPEPGTATLSVLSARDFPAGARLEVRVLHDGPKGLKEVLETKAIKTKTGDVSWENETTRVPCTADAHFRLTVRDNPVFGKHEDLGEAAFFIGDQGAGGEKEVKVGDGVVVVRSSFAPAETGSIMSNAQNSSDKGSSLGGPLRKSFMGNRRERSVTPSN